jgi:hypothetical protein
MIDWWIHFFLSIIALIFFQQVFSVVGLAEKMINVGLLLGYADGVHFSALLLRFHFWDCCIVVGTFAPLPPHASGNKLVFIV